MKTFKRTYLPDTITYKGETYTVNPSISTGMILSGTSLNKVEEAVKSTGKKAICIEVLPYTLKHKTDLHGKPYKPTKHIFTT